MQVLDYDVALKEVGLWRPCCMTVMISWETCTRSLCTLHVTQVIYPTTMRWENLGLGAISLKLSLRRKGGEGRRRELNSVECGFWKTLSTTTKVLLLPSGTPRNLAQPSIASLVMGHFGWMNVSAVDGEGVRRGIRIVQGLLYSAPNSLAFLRQPIALRHSVLGGSVIWFLVGPSYRNTSLIFRQGSPCTCS